MRLIKSVFLSVLLLFLSPTRAFACDPDEIPTGLGCIPDSPERLVVEWLLPNAIKIAGGIAFLMFLGGAFTLMTSAGDPEKVNKGKEAITAALSGLLFIIFSVYLLRVIGYDILRIPGFTN